MDTLLATFPALAPYAVYVAAFCGFMAFVAQYLPPPSATSSKTYDAVYAFVNWTGWNNLHASNVSAPPANTIIKIPTSLMVLLATAITLSACNTPAATDVQPCLMSIAPVATPQVQAIADGSTTDGTKAISSAKVVAVDAAASASCQQLATDLQTQLAK